MTLDIIRAAVTASALVLLVSTAFLLRSARRMRLAAQVDRHGVKEQIALLHAIYERGAPVQPGQHGVEIEFEGEYGFRVKLICPESGCQPVTFCGECEEPVRPGEPCGCGSEYGDECWARAWFEGADNVNEWFHGKVVAPVLITWGDDEPHVEIVRTEVAK